MSALAPVVVLIGAIIGTEYFARHYLLLWIPVIGSLLVNDMVVLAIAYLILPFAIGKSVGIVWRDELRGVAASLRDLTTQWHHTRWLLVLMLAIVTFSLVDQLLFGRLRLPMYISEWRNPIILIPGAAAGLEIVSRIVVNGMVVPVAEEFLWRGVIQKRLSRILPTTSAIAITAIAFSLKHAIVDASFSRFLTIVAFGVICGIVAARSGWRSSAALHLTANTLATVGGLLIQGPASGVA